MSPEKQAAKGMADPMKPRGRPRSGQAHQAILAAALAELARSGFRALTVDAIAARAGVGKMTVYRRWPNKAAVVMDAFLSLVGPATAFPEAPRAIDRIRGQMRLQAAFFNGKFGRAIKALLGEAQFDAELAEAFRDRWLTPRRQMTRRMLREAVRQGDLRADRDLETVIDLLYGPIYYRLQLGTGPITAAYMEGVFARAMRGLARPSASA